MPDASEEKDTVSLHITNRDERTPVVIPQLASDLLDLQSLVFISTLGTFLDWEEFKPGEPHLFETIVEGALASSIEFNIHRLSLNSPLDLVLAASKAVPVAADSASKLVKLVNAVEDLRVKHAHTNNEVLAANILRDELKMERASKKKIRKAELLMVENAISRASVAAERITHVHVEL